jgi:hypothetical protein
MGVHKKGPPREGSPSIHISLNRVRPEQGVAETLAYFTCLLPMW